ncbi:coiled-coil domain-containing protein 102A-like [Liolophura sinensis]|uniref:coiled-coil domain-containing protein 102A-like n=1 Tax=Liolophura sinensis TaxID=3198878 RepID=UPI0031580B2B
MSQKVNSSMGPKADAPFAGASGHGYTPLSPGGKESRKTLPHSPSPHMVENDWDGQDDMRKHEVEEARARAAQMEKTMRWWSDCTANWREKWSKVRNERNKARDENRHLRTKLEAVIKECTLLKREKQELRCELEQVKKPGTGMVQMICDGQRLGMDGDLSAPDNTCESAVLGGAVAPVLTSQPDLSKLPDSSDFMHKILKKDSDSVSVVSETMERLKQTRQKLDDVSIAGEESIAEEKLSLLEMKLEESQKTIQVERDEKSSLTRSIEKMQTELNSYKTKYEEAKKARQDTMLELTKLKDSHKDEIGRIVLELEDESTSRSTMDRRLGELRKELERLQSENAAEWGKRERLETEKLSLERENKKLRILITDLEEQVERKNQQASTMMDSDMKTLQYDLSEKTKELNELRHAHSKLRKTLQEKSTELEHTRRRAEQYELEVKKLRGRVEELKRELSTAEDEADSQANLVRKLQRSNDELQEQVDNLQLQVEHLQSRLRSASQPLLKTRSSSLKSFEDKEVDDEEEDADSEDDLDDLS